MKVMSLPAPGKPLATKRGKATVKIYAGANRLNGASCQQFTLACYNGAPAKETLC
jgi:hypothetical protein